MPKPQELIKPRVVDYLKSAWYTRWGVIAVLAASLWFLPLTHRHIIIALLLAAAAYNLLLLFGNQLNLRISYSRALILFIDGVIALVLVMYTGAEHSPYFLILGFMVVSGAYWYGALTSVGIGLTQMLFLTVQLEAQQQSLTFPAGLTVRMLVLIILGVYVSLLTRPDRSERHELLNLGIETEKERQQLLALINNMRDAVLVVDNGGTIVIYNQAAATLAGGRQELKGHLFSAVIRLEDEHHQAVELKLKQTGGAFERKDLCLRDSDNSLVNVAISAAPYIVDRQNRGHVLIIRDITQDKTIDKEREEFIAVASHELRTPLTIAQGDVSLLLTPSYMPKNPESVDMLGGALRSLQQLSHIIKDLTNLSRVENEELDVELDPLDPIALVHEFEKDYADQVKLKGLKLEVIIDKDLNSATILTSRYVVREILSIFITNAIKFTDEGTVVMRIMNPKDESSGVTFAVSDTGIGISRSDQKKIFEKFFQSEHYATRTHGGTGLGLYIAKRLTTRITGRLWFETELGKGSTFYLWVPPYSKHKQDSGKVAAAEAKDFFDTA